MYIKGVPRKKKFSCLSSQKFLYPSLFLSVSLRLLCTESAFPIKDWSIFVHKRHELQKSSDKINFLKIKTAYDTKRKLHQWVLINTTKCPESDGLISALSLLFVEAATLYSSSSSEKSGPDFPRFYFTSPRIEMEIPGGWGSYLFPSCLMLTSCPSLGKLLSFSSIQKAPINVDNSHGKVFEFRCYWKKYKK